MREPGAPRTSKASRAGPRWCMRTPKGWTGPTVVDGVQIEGTFRSHQVPVSDVTTNPAHLAILETWLRSYRARGAVRRRWPARARCARTHPRRPAADGGESERQRRSAPRARSSCLTRRLFAVPVAAPATELRESTRSLGEVLKYVYQHNARRGELPAVLPGRDELEPARRGVRRREPVLAAASYRRRRSPRARRPGDGGAERAPLPRLARDATC